MRLNAYFLGLITIVLADAMPRCSCGAGRSGPYSLELHMAIVRIDVDDRNVFPGPVPPPPDRDTVSAHHFYLDAETSVQVVAGIPTIVEIMSQSDREITARWDTPQFLMPSGDTEPAVALQWGGAPGETERDESLAVRVQTGKTYRAQLAPKSYVEYAREEDVMVPDYPGAFDEPDSAEARGVDALGDHYVVRFDVEIDGVRRRCRVESIVIGYGVPRERDG